MPKDYTENKYHAQELVDKILAYHRKNGHTWVKVWLEAEIQPSGRRFWNVRSNIVFKTPVITSK